MRKERRPPHTIITRRGKRRKGKESLSVPPVQEDE